MRFWNGSGISWTICRQSAPRSRHNHTNTSSLNFYSPDALLDSHPTVLEHWRYPIHCLYFLTQLKRSGASTEDLVCVSTSVIRTVLEYACPLWHSSLTTGHFACKKVRVAHTRLLSVGFLSWSRFLAVSLQVTWVINPAVGYHYFPPGLQLSPQPLRGLLPILLLGEQRHNGCEQFA